MPAAAQNTTGTTTSPSAPGAVSAPVGGDQDRDWGWLGLLGLLGLAGLMGRRDTARDLGGTRTGTGTGTR
jgi:hypothetical protein